METKMLAGFFSNPIVIILLLLAIFGLIVIGVILLKKYVKPFKSDEKPKSEKEIAEEELNRILEDVDDEKTAEAINSYGEPKKKKEKELPPTPEEAAAEEVDRLVEPVTDEEAAKAMEEYEKEHGDEGK